MAYIPQEAKEQIASLMSDVEELEEHKRELLNQVLIRNRKQDGYKAKIRILLTSLIGTLVFVVYTYVRGPVFGSYKNKVQNYEALTLDIKDLQAENIEYKSEVERLSRQLGNKSYSARKVLDNSNSVSMASPELIYRVQIGAYRMFKMGLYSSDMTGVLERREGGFNKYSLGMFDTYKDALKFKTEVKRMGIRTAFLVAERNGRKISVTRALSIEKRKK